MEIIDLVVMALAARAIVDAWMHPGGLFETVRERIHTWGEFQPRETENSSYSEYVPPTLSDRLRYRVAQLFLCRVCLTYHVSAIVLVMLWLSHVLPAWLSILRMPVYAFAVAGLANILLPLTKDSSE
jgi:hypothetical protein